MLKLFLVIYHGSQVGGYYGPLPYDQIECENRRAPMEQARLQAIETGLGAGGIVIPEKNMAIMKQMRFSCEYRPDKPVVELE